MDFRDQLMLADSIERVDTDASEGTITVRKSPFGPARYDFTEEEKLLMKAGKIEPKSATHEKVVYDVNVHIDEQREAAPQKFTFK